MTLNPGSLIIIISPRLQAFSNAIRRTLVQYFTRCQLTARLRGPSATASSVKLHGTRIISGKLLAFGFVTTMRLLSNYVDLLLSPSTQSNLVLHRSSVEDRRLFTNLLTGSQPCGRRCCRLPALTDPRLPVVFSQCCLLHQ